MADVGIRIRTQDTVLGAPPDVNANSILFFPDTMILGQQTPEGSVALEVGKPHLITSYDEIKDYIFTRDDLITLVRRFYNPTPTVDNTGTKLWLVPTVFSTVSGATETLLLNAFKATVANGFENRPRNLMYYTAAPIAGDSGIATQLEKISLGIADLYRNGFACVALVQNGPVFPDANAIIRTLQPAYTDNPMPFVGFVPLRFDPVAGDIALTAVGGYMASLPVGTSIGDASLPPFANELYIDTETQLPCSAIGNNEAEILGGAQVIFARTRPPRNGLWLNDGATLNKPENALSTLEAGRTMAAMVDDLRAFFTPYLNNKIPVNNDGDIQSTYKQVVLDNARESVINRYIESGDISDARIQLKAKDNDMIGTRQWEVTLSILPAPTLRWIDGFVFYVNSL